MAVNITIGAAVSVAGGPSIKSSHTLPVDAYDLIDVAIADGAGELVVEVQPSSAAGQVQFLLVSASQFNPNLTYRVNDPANPAHALDRALLLTDGGAAPRTGARR